MNRYSYVLDNPVRYTDPSGHYYYKYTWAIGTATDILDSYNNPAHATQITAQAAMAYLQQHPQSVFPFGIVGTCGETTIQLGATYELTRITGIAGLNINNYVQVTNITDTSFTFTSVGGLDPVGSTITFRTYEKDGVVYLEQEAQTSVQLCFGFICVQDDLVKSGAEGTWRQQAENLRNAFYGRQGPIPGPPPEPVR